MPAHKAGTARVSSTVTKRNPRPRKYASASERQAAYRDRAAEVCFRAEAKTVETLDRIAAKNDRSRAELLLSMTKFALANHDWARFGLTHRPLPYGYGLAEQEFIGPRQANPQPIWKRTRPKSLNKPVPLTPKQKAAAKKRAAAAGRKYPNLVDNIAAARMENPTMPTIYTVKSEYLIADAERIERDANQSLNAWILLGQSEKYSEAMKTASMLRQAAATKNMTTRREILRNAGFTVKTPKQVTSSLEGEPRKENPAMKKPTPAQLAARARFAEMARSGAFKRKAKKAKANPAKKTVSQKISQLTREGYPQKQAIAIALSEERAGKVKRNPRASNPAKFTASQLASLRDHYSMIETIDPSSDSYIKLTAKLDAMSLPVLKQLANARIKWISALARNRVTRMERKTNPATGRRGSGTKLNPIVSEARSRLPSNFKYGVQTKATENWGLQAAFKTKAEAVDYAHAIAKNYPRLPIRVITFTGGPI